MRSFTEMLRTEKTIKGRLRCGCKWSVSSFAELCPTLCTPVDCSTLGLLSITNSWSSLKLMFIESVMPSNHLILCCPLLLLPSIFPSIRVFSKELVLHIRWSKYWSFSFSRSPSKEHSGLISFKIDWLGLLEIQGTLKSFFPTPQFKSINSLALSFLYSPTLTSIYDYWKKHSFRQWQPTPVFLPGKFHGRGACYSL